VPFGTPTNRHTLNGGTLHDDGSWTVQTHDVRSLTVTSPADYVGALVLNVTETWTNQRAELFRCNRESRRTLPPVIQNSAPLQ
jgi:hypothetical protein